MQTLTDTTHDARADTAALTRRARRCLLLGAIIPCLAVNGCGSSGSLAGRRDASTIRKGNRIQLVYLAYAGTQPVTASSIEATIDIMRKRVEQFGVAEANIQRAGVSEIDVSLPDVSGTVRAEQQVGKTAQLFFYDWEPNVIGPTGQPAPTEATVTGGQNAGSATAGLPEYEAVQRALKRPAIIRSNDTTWQQGCTPQQVNGCIYGQWHLLDTAGKKVLRGPEDSEQNLYADGYRPPAGAKAKAVRVNPGTVLARAQPILGADGKVTKESPESWYVLNDNPALTGADIRNPRQGFDQGAGGNGQPNVTFEFSSSGGKTFQRVTREIAQRGQQAQLPGIPKQSAVQHFAVVLDNQIITAPFIDFTVNPEGIEASTGSQISGGFTIVSAQNLADELQSGALPIKLELISQSQVSATQHGGGGAGR